MNSSDLENIKKTAQLYVDGLKYSDASKIEKGFHPEFRMHGLDGEGHFQQYTRNSFIEAIKSEDHTTEEPLFEGGIVDVNHGDQVATVKIRLENEELVYTDFLSLLKVDGEWTVIHKIWETDLK